MTSLFLFAVPLAWWLSHPDFVVLVIIAGALLVYLEFNIPGTVVPGALGLLCILLGGFALSQLPLHPPALAALFAALVLILLEAKLSTHGVLAALGTLCLIFGLATLVDSPVPALRVHLSTAIAAGTAFGAISFFLAGVALKARRNKVLTGPHAMLRRTATVVTPIAPIGQVEVRGEIWQARFSAAAMRSNIGEHVRVTAIDGLVLVVSPVGEPE